MVAYNSVLVLDVLGTTRMVPGGDPVPPGPDADELLVQLWDVHNDITAKNLQGPYHDALELKEEALTRFNLGLVDLETRAEVEGMFWRIVEKLVRTSKGQKYLPEEVGDLEKALADIYFCNFSLFQSAPDSWAIEQLFPILPIHRLDEQPVRKGVLADITCDSDGKIDKFIDLRDVKHALELHEPDGRPYYLGVFLLGAYQEILGDLHNLFGDTNAVHIRAVPGGQGYRIEHVVEGDTVTEVLRYVQYERDQLLSGLRRAVEDAITAERLTPEEGRLLVANYVRGLEAYTYLGND
jgi:arginine decarboxylase